MKLRIRYTKLGKIRFLGNLDLARCWERAIRRAELPVAYSEGFSPRPKLHYGLALPVGAESLAEYIDVDLRDAVDLVGVDGALTNGLPDGVEVTAVAEERSNATALQAEVDRCTWRFEVDAVAPDALARDVERVMASETVLQTIVRKRKEITEDVRPALGSLTVTADGPRRAVLTADLVMKPRSLRPSELLACLGIAEARRICRIEQWKTTDAGYEPLLAAADPVAAGPAVRPPER